MCIRDRYNSVPLSLVFVDDMAVMPPDRMEHFLFQVTFHSHENTSPDILSVLLYKPPLPQEPKTAEHYYIFKGWNNDLSHIEKDTMAKAVFEERERSFTVAFFHEDGTVLKKEEVLYGQEAHAPQSPVKQQDAVWHLSLIHIFR